MMLHFPIGYTIAVIGDGHLEKELTDLSSQQ